MPDKPEQLAELRTPLQIVNRIGWVLHYLKKATKAINDLRARYTEAKDDYSIAVKQYKYDHRDEGGTVDQRQEYAELACKDLYAVMRAAELELQFAKEKKDDLASELSALQTEAGLVKQELNLQGKL